MTEKEWLECTDPMAMLEFLRDKASDRKLRLFAVGCCLRVWDGFDHDESKRAITVAESYADSETTDERLQDAYNLAPHDLAYGAAYAAHADAFTAAWHGSDQIRLVVHSSHDNDDKCEWSEQANLIRCIFGNPFRPVTIDPRWLTADVTDLSRAIYEDKAFDRMPILADALMDAGCDNDDIIGHCRGDGPHVRGCWVVDLLLGKQ